MVEIIVGLLASTSLMYNNGDVIEPVKEQREMSVEWSPKNNDQVVWVLDKPAELQGRE